MPNFYHKSDDDGRENPYDRDEPNPLPKGYDSSGYLILDKHAQPCDCAACDRQREDDDPTPTDRPSTGADYQDTMRDSQVAAMRLKR